MAREHEKVFQAICRQKVSKGLINQADGNWKPSSTMPTENEHHILAGYRRVGSKASKQKGRKAK